MAERLLRRVRAFAVFLGRRAVLWGTAGVLLGAFAYLLDLAFVYSLQILLRELGSTRATVLPLPDMLARAEFHHGLTLLVGLHLLRSGVRWCGTLSATALTSAFRLRVRSRLVRWAFGRRTLSGHDAIFLFTETTSQASQALSALRLAGREALVAVLLGATLFWIHPVLATGGVAGLAVFAAVRRFSRRFRKISGAPQRDARLVLRRLTAGLRNLTFIRLHGLETREGDTALARLREMDADQRGAGRAELIAPVLTQVLGTVLGVALIFAAFMRLEIRPGLFVLFLYFYFRFVQSLARAHGARSRYAGGRPALQRLLHWWNESQTEEEPPPPTLPPGHPLRDRATVEGPIGWVLRDVEFGFEGAPPLFGDLNLSIAPGALLAIEGPSGAGKSSLLNLLLGEDAPLRGSVHAVIDGVEAPVAAVRELLLAHCAYSGPEPFLMEGTIRENIFFGLSGPPDPEFLRAMQAVSDCGFIDALPRGLDHVITDQGTGLSAGQKQRLSLLRALLRRPRALVLDEATGHLDPETEARVLAGLRALRGGMTIVCVSHREQVLGVADARLRLG